MINSLNFTASHPRQQSSALLAKLGNVSLKIKKKYAYIALLMETLFGINESTVRGMIKARPVPDNIKHSSKCNFPGTWRPPIFPVELDDEIMTRILTLWGLHFCVRFEISKERFPSFSANCGWVNKFFTRHNLALRARISISQNLLYPFSLVGKMVETPAQTPSKCIAKKECVVLTKCVVRSSGSEKKHLTVLSSATAYGQMLPPMIIFRGKTDQTICNLIIPPDCIVKTHEKAWIGYDLMKIWVE